MDTRVEYITRRLAVPSDLTLRDWLTVPARLRENCFFISRCTDPVYLEAYMEALKYQFAHGCSETETRRFLRLYLQERGYVIERASDVGYNHPVTPVKMRICLDLYTGFAYGMEELEKSLDGSYYPAWELKRFTEEAVDDDWDERWGQAVAAVGGEGVAQGSDGAKIALASSPVWAAFSDFGHPYPPFRFNSRLRVYGKPSCDCEAFFPPEELRATHTMPAPMAHEDVRQGLAGHFAGLAEWKDGKLLYINEPEASKIVQDELDILFLEYQCDNGDEDIVRRIAGLSAQIGDAATAESFNAYADSLEE